MNIYCFTKKMLKLLGWKSDGEYYTQGTYGSSWTKNGGRLNISYEMEVITDGKEER